MKVLRFLPLLLLPILLLLAACDGQQETKKDKEKVYDIKGKVLALDPNNKKVNLDHEEIPGWMLAMKMWFEVSDTKILAGLKEGDQVQGKVKVQADGKYFITELKKQ